MLLGSIELNVEAADEFTAAVRRKQGSVPVRELVTTRHSVLQVTNSCPAVV